ncbi:flagellar biosynthetic protein FliO [Fulvimarina pelagi]|uniref:flagellar biosynthetic protein FliO n=1 Tax=Fulvimarina pelagi TaxID=217511 RepID=UPI0034E300B4
MGFRGQAPRLALVETLSLGDRRRLVLVRRDGEEHLLLIGGNGDVVIERNVGRAAQSEVDTSGAEVISNRSRS